MKDYKKSLKKLPKKRLEEYLLQIQRIVDNSSDAIISETLDGVITSWNKGAEKMFGYTAEEVIGKPSTYLLPPDVQIQMISLFKKIKKGKSITDYDSAVLHKNGKKVDISISLAPIFDHLGSVVGVSVVERDIRERKKAQNKILEMRQVRDKFIKIISHQLRTPLTSINWNLESILQGSFGKLKQTQQEFLRVTHEASEEITRRINNLLIAMDIEEKRTTYETEDVILDNLCTEVTGKMIRKCKLKGISCVYTPSVKSTKIKADAGKMRIVISQLLENAIIYTEQGGSIASSLKRYKNTIRYEVRDSGIGIPHSEQYRVFTRFFRASNASTMNPDGFGLGLYIVKNFIKDQGGKIGFKSKLGEGSTFWFEIPYLK